MEQARVMFLERKAGKARKEAAADSFTSFRLSTGEVQNIKQKRGYVCLFTSCYEAQLCLTELSASVSLAVFLPNCITHENDFRQLDQVEEEQLCFYLTHL